MGSVPKMTAEDKEWMIKEDVRILTEAEKIKMDPNRMSAAKKMASAMAEAAKVDATTMAKIANHKVVKAGTKKAKK